jgi:hypothetical protein
MAPPIRPRSPWLHLWFPSSLVGLTLLLLPGIALLIVNLFGLEPRLNGWLKDNLGLTYHLAPPWWLSLLIFLVPLLLLLLYFLKMRRQPQKVPSTFLWRKSVEDMRVNSLFQWLRENVLLLLQLLTVLLLIYCVMQFQKHGGFNDGKHYILVIDSSASMASSDVPPTRLDQAKAQALAEIDRHGDNDPGMVIEFNSTASTRQSYTTDRGLLRAAVSRIVQTERTTSILDVLGQIKSLANPRGSAEDQAVRPDKELPGQARSYVVAEGISAEVHIFSDGRFDMPREDFDASNLTLNYHPIGQPGANAVDNVGIVTLSASKEDEKVNEIATLRVFVAVRNYRTREATVKVKMRWALPNDADFGIREQSLKLRAHSDAPPDPTNPTSDNRSEDNVIFELPNIPVSAVVRVHVWLDEHHDQFPLDDHAWLVVGMARKARIVVVSEGNNPEGDTVDKKLAGNRRLRNFFGQPAMALKADILGLRPTDLSDKALYLDPAAGGRFDLVIFDRCAPASKEAMPEANTYFIFDVPPPWKKSAMRPLRGIEIVNATSLNPLMRHLTGLDEIAFTEAFRFPDLPPPRQRLLETAARKDGEPENNDSAVLFTLRRGHYTDLIQAFPLVNDKGEDCTNWFKKVSFPLFLDNVVDQLGNISQVNVQELLRAGGSKTFRPASAVSEIKVQIVDPKTNSPPMVVKADSAGEFPFKDTERLGMYRASWDGGGEEYFAVNLLDANESDIQPRETIQLGTQTVTGTAAGGQPRDLWKWLAVGALGLLLLEWFLYHKRFFV